MYSAALQRYYNEHEHLPYTFYAQPKRFTQYAIEKRGELLATAYNYIEPDAKGTRDFVEYSSADFTVTDFHSADRVCVVMRLPEPTMPLHCKMIGCSVKFDGSCPVWRTVELTEQGSFLLCGWNADHLYAEYCDVNLHTAYEELCKIFGPDGGEPVRKCKRKPRSIETVELPIASAEVRDNTYSNLLSLLTLCPTHQSALKERGLKSEEMELLCYRTTPTTRLKRIVTELLERGCTLDGVPGFYCQKDSGQWVLDIRGSGIMLPDRNLLGQIEAIQVRLDKVYNQKFYNLTSVDQYYGTQSKCCPHYVGVHEGDEVVCLTEGVMKSDLAYSFAQGSPYECGFVGLTGIPSYSQYERALEELDSIGVKRINVMVDSDYQVKEEVRKARDRYIEMGAAAGFEMVPITWTQKRKGVDDLYKHLFRNK